MVKKCLSFFFFLVITYSSIAQTYNYRNFKVEDGLAGNSVYMAIQDSKGYVWFASSEGVSRFDGSNFITYTTENGLGDNDVLRVAEDHNQRVWFLSFNGHLSFYSIKDEKVHNELTDPWLKIAATGSGFFYAFTDLKDRVWFCNIAGHVFMLEKDKMYSIAAEGLEAAESCISQGANERIYMYNGYCSYLFDEQTKKFKLESTNIPHSVSTYYRGKSGSIFYRSNDQLIKIRNGKINIIDGLQIPDSILKDIATVTDIDSSIYISTRRNGIFVYSQNSRKKLITFPFEKPVNSVFFDNEQNFWIMTREGGVYMLPYQFQNSLIFPLNYFNQNNIFSIIEAGNGKFWIGGSDDKIYSFSEDKITEFSLFKRKTKTKTRIVNFVKDKKGKFWTCNDPGICSFKTAFTKNSMIPYDIDTFISEYRVLNITFNNENDAIITVPIYLGKLINLPKVKIALPLKNEVELVSTYFSYYTKSNKLYVANIHGLNELVDDHLIPFGDQNALLNSKIISMVETEDSTLVLATDDKGVLFFKNGKIINRLTSSSGLQSGIYRKIKIYKDEIFVCTNHGLNSFTYKNNKCSNFHHYSLNTGLISNDVIDLATENNLLYVVTSAGLSVIPKYEHNFQQQSPPLYIISITDKKNQVLDRNKCILSSENNFIKITFNAITFNNPSELAFQYSFDQKNENWIYTQSKEVILPDLPPGRYYFAVKTKAVNSQWSKSTGFSFIIKPPFYKTWWFVTIIFGVAAGMITLLFLYENRKKQRVLLNELEKRNALNVERHRISADMHDDLGSDLSRIAITAELIKFDHSNEQNVLVQLQKINDISGSARKKMDDIIWALNPTNDNLPNLIAYVNKYCLNYFEGTQVNVQVEDEVKSSAISLNARQRRNIFLVIKEVSTNVLKHSTAHQFTILFRVNSDKLEVELKDDGKGFDPNQENKGQGLNNIRTRIADLNGTVILKQDLNGGMIYFLCIPL